MPTTAANIRERCPGCTFDHALATNGVTPASRYRGARFPDDLGTDAAGYPRCPACGKQSLYDWGSDRTLHTDGTDNGPCWLARSRGVTTAAR